MQNFWQQLPKPIIGLSPMDGVTDAPMRYITAKYGKPDVIITEFTHTQGLWVGKLEMWKDFLYDEIERPVVAQIFGSDPEYFYKAAHIVCELGFDGIDINMGCPADNVVKKGGGASLILDPERAKAIIRETKRGVRDWAAGQEIENLSRRAGSRSAGRLEKEKIQYIRLVQKDHGLDFKHERKTIPVSVKSRIGYDKIVVKEWVKHLIEAQPITVTLHGRTLKQLYRGDADWEALGSVSNLLKEAGILYLGNGDVKSREEALAKIAQYGMDGILIGRASFGNPWVFDKTNPRITPSLRLKTALEHTQLHWQLKGEKRFHEVRKHLGWYCKDFEGAKELRIKLLTAKGLEEMEKLITEFSA